MNHSYFTEMTSNALNSTETIYEIKAPLATFDTVDLGDDELSLHSIKSSKSIHMPDKSEKGAKDNSEVETMANEISLVRSSIDSSIKDDPYITPTEEKAKIANTLDTDSSNTISETDNQGVGTSSEMHEPNSSENNASAEDIQNKLKLKGRKYKEKATNVKYEKIDNSDVSDQEKPDTCSPLPGFKFKQPHKTMYDTDSESSDSDDGFSSGFISKGGNKVNMKPGLHYIIERHSLGTDSVDSDSTPCASPQPRRATVPPPLSEEEAKQKSKKKAYEKRLQRLQVTTKPIERPRSTTPINIFGLDEYVSISSPEKSPTPVGNLEKLKIKLPVEDVSKIRSPRKSRTSESHDFFNYEDKLFTHTKSAVLVENGGTRGNSPKRILLPPALSPKFSPILSPRSPLNQPKYIYSPKLQRNVQYEEIFGNETWAQFDDVPKRNGYEMGGNKENKHSATVTNHVNGTKEKMSDENNGESVVDFNDVFESLGLKGEHIGENEEILTVNVKESGGEKICDISCDVIDTSVSSSKAHNKCEITSQNNAKTETLQKDSNKELRMLGEDFSS